MKLEFRDGRAMVRCYVEPKKDQWQAFCLDLTLAAQADTREQAFDKLYAMIMDNVNESPRRAPLRYWLKYYCYVALDKVRHPSPTN